MSNIQIKDLTLKTNIDGTEDILIQDSGVTKRIKASELISDPRLDDILETSVTSEYVIMSGEFSDNYFAMADSSVHINQSQGRAMKKFSVKGGAKYRAHGVYQASEWASLYIITDVSGRILYNYFSNDASDWHTNPVEFVAPDTSAYVYVNGTNASGTLPVVEPQLYVLNEVETTSFTLEKDVDGIKNDVNALKSVFDESHIDRKIRKILNNAKVIGKLGSVDQIPSNVKKVSESLYGDSGVVITSLTNNAYTTTLDIQLTFEDDKKHFLVFKTDREELMVTKAFKVSLYDTTGVEMWTSGTDYNFSYGLTNGWNMYEMKDVPAGSYHKISFRLSNITADKLPNIIWDSIICDRKIKPFVLYCTDNGTVNCYDTIAPILKANNMKACTSIGPDTNLTDEQIKSLSDNGWDFSVYAVDNFSAISNWTTFVSEESNYEAIKNGIRAIINGNMDKGIPFPSAYMCRSNMSTPVLLRAIKSNGIDLVRTSNRNGIFQNFTVDDMEIPCVGLTDNNLDKVKGYLDYAVENGFGICVFTHQVVSGGDPNLINVGIDTFTSFCEYCNQYITRGELVSYNAKDTIGYFTNSDISSVDIRETQFKISRLLENQ